VFYSVTGSVEDSVEDSVEVWLVVSLSVAELESLDSCESIGCFNFYCYSMTFKPVVIPSAAASL